MRPCSQVLIGTAAVLALIGQPSAADHSRQDHATSNRAPQTCSAQSTATVAPLIELYTSEGCSSCPPADRWLSRRRDDPAVVALAFHVDYWDKLGWKDRFASPAYSLRQARQQPINGARFSYTPQVVLNGRDQPRWHAAPLPTAENARTAATVTLTLSYGGDEVMATILPDAGAPARLAAYWAVTEDGHFTAVRAGENRGEGLRHDAVVREYVQVPEWAAHNGTARTLRFMPKQAESTDHPRHINLVVIDAVTGKPLQAIRPDC
ncbi:MAG: DUF1223 domain-containing protein [Azoarcus sp. PHD]|nr:MAG: DUF1223 domain-containing protein [Azoarcus sp. PHD]